MSNSEEKNRTAEEIWQRHLEASFKEHGIGHKYFIGAMEEYASQQTASLREENEKLHGIYNSAVKGRADFREVYRKSREECNRLQEEVERLTKVLEYCQSKAYTIVNTKNAINHKYVKRDAVKMKDAIDAALSGKESKTDNL